MIALVGVPKLFVLARSPWPCAATFVETWACWTFATSVDFAGDTTLRPLNRLVRALSRRMFILYTWFTASTASPIAVPVQVPAAVGITRLPVYSWSFAFSVSLLVVPVRGRCCDCATLSSRVLCEMVLPTPPAYERLRVISAHLSPQQHQWTCCLRVSE